MCMPMHKAGGLASSLMAVSMRALVCVDAMVVAMVMMLVLMLMMMPMMVAGHGD